MIRRMLRLLRIIPDDAVYVRPGQREIDAAMARELRRVRERAERRGAEKERLLQSMAATTEILDAAEALRPIFEDSPDSEIRPDAADAARSVRGIV